MAWELPAEIVLFKPISLKCSFLIRLNELHGEWRALGMNPLSSVTMKLSLTEFDWSTVAEGFRFCHKHRKQDYL